MLVVDLVVVEDAVFVKEFEPDKEGVLDCERVEEEVADCEGVEVGVELGPTTNVKSVVVLIV